MTCINKAEVLLSFQPHLSTHPTPNQEVASPHFRRPLMPLLPQAIAFSQDAVYKSTPTSTAFTACSGAPQAVRDGSSARPEVVATKNI